MLRAILIDDEPLACKIVQEYLEPYEQISIAEICYNGFEGLKAIQQLQPDLIFLDIQMPKINGFEMLELIENPPAVIFTTAFDEYAIKAFEHHAVDYLLKPFSQDRFNKAVNKFIQQHAAENQDNRTSDNTRALLESTALSPQQADRIVIRDNSNIRIIPIDEIHYIEAADDYARISTSSGNYLKNRTMQSLEQQLPASVFVRIHRSYILNIREITQLHPNEKETYTAILKSGKKLPVSKTGYAKLKAILGMDRH
jgi:two-component system LytT family response regulator